MLVAGHAVPDAGGAVRSYVNLHRGTVANFDRYAGSSRDELTADLIRRTRTPWMNSRISKKEERWFLDRAQTAVSAAKNGNRLVPELDLDHAAGGYARIIFDGIPVVGMHAGCARPLPGVAACSNSGSPLRAR